jgi:hypothetical protein
VRVTAGAGTYCVADFLGIAWITGIGFSGLAEKLLALLPRLTRMKPSMDLLD